jgi:hypothetical protein
VLALLLSILSPPGASGTGERRKENGIEVGNDVDCPPHDPPVSLRFTGGFIVSPPAGVPARMIRHHVPFRALRTRHQALTTYFALALVLLDPTVFPIPQIRSGTGDSEWNSSLPVGIWEIGRPWRRLFNMTRPIRPS